MSRSVECLRSAFISCLCALSSLSACIPSAAGAEASTPVTAGIASSTHQTLLMDLSSTAANLQAANLLGQIGPGHPAILTIVTGDKHQTVTTSSLLTPAEMVAAYQVLRTGHQSLMLGVAGNAVGGTFNIGAKLSQMINNLVIPAGVSALVNFTSMPALKLAGDLVNGGKLYAYSTSSSQAGAFISAASVTNLPGGVISTVVPAKGLGLTAAASSLDLSIGTTGNIFNSGTISSSGNLALSAGGTITNALPQGTAGKAPVVEAAGNVTLVANNVGNSGLVNSITGNINVLPAPGGSLAVNNSGGTLQALNGEINVGDPAATAKVNLSIAGGSFISPQLNLYSGSGAADLRADAVSGTVNVTAGTANVAVTASSLHLGAMNLSGDPTFYDATGNLTIDQQITGTGDLAIIASGNISATPSGSIASTFTDITMIAGAQFKPPTPNNGATNISGQAGDVSNSFVITGASSTGGNIDLVNSGFTSSGLQANGNLQLLAFGVGGKNNGVINVQGISLTGQNVTLIADHPGIFTGIILGSITTSGTNGNVTLALAPPVIPAGGIVIAAGGAAPLISPNVSKANTAPLTEINEADANGIVTAPSVTLVGGTILGSPTGSGVGDCATGCFVTSAPSLSIINVFNASVSSAIPVTLQQFSGNALSLDTNLGTNASITIGGTVIGSGNSQLVTTPSGGQAFGGSLVSIVPDGSGAIIQGNPRAFISASNIVLGTGNSGNIGTQANPIVIGATSAIPAPVLFVNTTGAAFISAAGNINVDALNAGGSVSTGSAPTASVTAAGTVNFIPNGNAADNVVTGNLLLVGGQCQGCNGGVSIAAPIQVSGSATLQANGTGTLVTLTSSVSAGSVSAATVSLSSGKGGIGLSAAAPFQFIAGVNSTDASGNAVFTPGTLTVNSQGNAFVTGGQASILSSASVAGQLVVFGQGTFSSPGSASSNVQLPGITVDGQVSAGSLTLFATNANIVIDSGSNVLSLSGGLTLRSHNGVSGFNEGIQVDSGAAITAVDGNISIFVGNGPPSTATTVPPTNIIVNPAGSHSVTFGTANSVIADGPVTVNVGTGSTITLDGGIEVGSQNSSNNGLVFAGNDSVSSFPTHPVSSLDLGNKGTVQQLQALNAAGLVSGTITTSASGAATAGTNITIPAQLFASALTANNIPSGVKVTIQNVSAPIAVNLTSNTTTTTTAQVEINGTESFISTQGASAGGFKITSGLTAPTQPIFSVGGGGVLASDGSLSVTVPGNATITGGITAAGNILLATTGNGSITLAGASAKNISSSAGNVTINAAGALIQAGAGSISAATVNLVGAAAALGQAGPILTDAANLAVSTQGTAGASVSNDESVNLLSSTVGGVLSLITTAGGITVAGAIKANQISLEGATGIILGDKSTVTSAGANNQVTLTADGASSITEAATFPLPPPFQNNSSGRGTGVISGDTVNLVSGSGNIGSPVAFVSIANGGGLNISTTGSAFIDSTGTLALRSAGSLASPLSQFFLSSAGTITTTGAAFANSINLSVQGPTPNGAGIAVNSSLTGTGPNSSIALDESDSGSITQGSSGAISAGTLNITTVTTVGTPAKPLTFTAAQLSASILHDFGGPGSQEIVPLVGRADIGASYFLKDTSAVTLTGDPNSNFAGTAATYQLTAGGTITLAPVTLNLSNAVQAGTVILQASNNGAVVVNGSIQASKFVAITASGSGSITQGSGASITAPVISLVTTGSGTIGQQGSPIATSTPQLSITAPASSAFINNTLGGTAPALQLGASAALATLSLSSDANVLVVGNLNAASLVLNVSGSISQASGVSLSVGSLTISATGSAALKDSSAVTLTSPAGGPSFSVGGALTLTDALAITVSSNLSVGSATFITSQFQNSQDITAAAGGTVALISPPGQSLTISGGGTLSAPGGITVISNGVAANQVALEFSGSQTFNGNTSFNSQFGTTVIDPSQTVTITGNLSGIAGALILSGTLSVSGSNTLALGSPESAGTIANPSGDVVLNNAELSSRFGQNLIILAEGNVLANGVTTINLSSPNRDGGNLVVMAGVAFSGSPQTPNVPDTKTLFTVSGPSR